MHSTCRSKTLQVPERDVGADAPVPLLKRANYAAASASFACFAMPVSKHLRMCHFTVQLPMPALVDHDCFCASTLSRKHLSQTSIANIYRKHLSQTSIANIYRKHLSQSLISHERTHETTRL